jgi:hypothetical protein
VRLSLAILQPLQHLTYLELSVVHVFTHDPASPGLQPLQALTRLVDLRLGRLSAAAVDGVRVTARVTASSLSGATCLTRLECFGGFEPGALAGKTRLRHLQLTHLRCHPIASGEAQLLSYLQPLQQLTHLNLRHGLVAASPFFRQEEATPRAAAYTAITTSSKLQHHNISGCILPAGVWQHLFPRGRQLPHLTSLSIARVCQPSRRLDEYAPVPHGSLLISCCPGLQHLNMDYLRSSGKLLAPLQGLSKLHTLSLSACQQAPAKAVRTICQLTRLRQFN